MWHCNKGSIMYFMLWVILSTTSPVPSVAYYQSETECLQNKQTGQICAVITRKSSKLV